MSSMVAFKNGTFPQYNATTDNQTDLGGSGNKDFLVTDYTEYWIAHYLNTYYPWVLCVLGVVCNAAVLATTLLTKPINTSSFYVATLSIIDTMALVLKLLYTVLTARNVSFGDTGCAIIMILGYFVVQFAVWTLTIITLERFVAVYFVFKVNSLFTMARARLSLFLLAVLLIGLNCHFIWTAIEVVDPVTGVQCGFRPEHAQFFQTAWYWMDCILSCMLPCGLLLVLNIMILLKLQQRQEKRKSIFGEKNTSAVRASLQNRQLTVMLLTLSIGTMTLLLPLSIFYVVATNWSYMESAHSAAVYLLVANLVHFTADCTHAMNFFFCFFGGGKFRKVLRSYVCRCRWNQLKEDLRNKSTIRSIANQSVKSTSFTNVNDPI